MGFNLCLIYIYISCQTKQTNRLHKIIDRIYQSQMMLARNTVDMKKHNCHVKNHFKNIVNKL